MGGLLASGFSRIVLTRLLDAKFQLDVRAILVCVVLTALLANAAGWFASFRILRQKPLEVLREE
jgi:putative ABC transport system permease protein